MAGLAGTAGPGSKVWTERMAALKRYYSVTRPQYARPVTVTDHDSNSAAAPAAWAGPPAPPGAARRGRPCPG
eukprot:655391-Hanusia_phi.AAC.1